MAQSEQEPSWKKTGITRGGAGFERREVGQKKGQKSKKRQRGWRCLGLTPRVPARSPGQQAGLSGEA